jgi:hypothetical protein
MEEYRPPYFYLPVEDEEFMELLERMSSRFDFDRDEAIELANEELHAMRREREERDRRFLRKPLEPS